MHYILASASPRRKELLSLIIKDFSVMPSSVDEVLPENIQTEFAPEYLAVKKAQEIARSHPEALVIGSDTGVFLDGVMLGKPQNPEDARAMLSSLSDKTHCVITGCALFYKGKSFSFSEKTLVEFYELDNAQIAEYILGGSPFDKAGAYGIQDEGGLFVKEIHGDYNNVVGLPVGRLAREIKNFLNLCGETDE